MKDSAAPPVETVTASFARIGRLGQQALEAETIDELRAIWELLCQAVAEHPLRMEPVADFEIFQRQIETQRAFRASAKRGSRWEYHGDDGSLVTGQAARRRFDAHLARPHMRANPRARGAGRPAVRGASKRSSSKSGDSGDDGLAEPEPSPAARLCEWCDGDISHKNTDARHCSPKHRVYANRARDRANPDRVAERSAARQRANGGVWTLLCDCDPTPELNDAGQCTHCGHPRSADAVDWLDDPPPPSRSFVLVGSPKRDRWKTRPTRSDAARLRKTRREFVDESIIRGAAA
jgi:hypothetical protein